MSKNECRMANVEPSRRNAIYFSDAAYSDDLKALIRKAARLDIEGCPTLVIIVVGRAAVCAMEEAAKVISDRLAGERECRFCGCTEGFACEGGCSWLTQDVCDSPECKIAYEQETKHHA
jgi:hypothetical protein